MLTFTRLLARQVQSLVRRTLHLQPRSYARTAVQLQGSTTGLTIRCATDTAAVEIHQEGPQPEEALLVPFTVFDDCAGKRSDTVTLERDGDHQISGQWRDGQVPQLYRYDQPVTVVEFPRIPLQLAENSPELLVALQQAMGIVDNTTSRYALNHVRLHGSDGSVAATDGRHLFVESGFTFGCDQDALIPRTTVFGCPELPRNQSVWVGIDEGWLTIRVGAVSLLWKLDPELRFPRVEDLLRTGEAAATTLDLGSSDAEFLRESLDSMPACEGNPLWVTVELNGSVAIRSQPTNRPRPVELILNSSRRTGAEVCFNTDCRYLAQAIDLGFRRFQITDSKSTIACRNGQRSYIWMPLTPENFIPSSAEMDRIESPTIPDTSHVPPQSPTKEQQTMTTPAPVPVQPAPKKRRRKRPSGQNELIDQAELLRGSLRESLRHTVELIRSLRQHRQQSKLMRSTLASLKQLQTVGD